MLIYPKSVLVIANTVLLALGTLEIVPPVGPFTLLVWGLKRVVPVRLTELRSPKTCTTSASTRSAPGRA